MGKVIDQWMCYKGVRGNREGVEDYFEGEGRLGFWGKWARMGVRAGPEFRNSYITITSLSRGVLSDGNEAGRGF